MSGQPNTRLADLFGLAGWSKGELARLVNRQAAAMGHPQLSTDTSRVRRWIDMGEIPRDPVPRVLAALFTERLGRVVTIEDLGLVRHGRVGKRQRRRECGTSRRRAVGARTDGRGPHRIHGNGPHAQPTRLGGRGRRARRRLRTQQRHARLAAHRSGPRCRRPRLDDPLHADPAGFDRYEAAPIGSQEIEELERSVEVFRAWDAARGGGLQRKAVVGQLNEVGGMLAYRHPDHLQRRLWGVAANLAVLAGWMSHDVGLEPTAQKYFVIAAHAAREGGDRPRAGEALSRAARQMVHLGRPDDALDLMKLAKSGSGEEMLPRTRAMLYTIEAWAQASMGKGQAMRRTLGMAEDLFVSDKGDVPPPSWMQMFDEADLHGMQALAFRTLADHEPAAAAAAQRHAKEALDLRAKGRDRSQIFDYISLASACFIADDPEQADRYARLALVSMGSNSSHRTWDRLREMYRLTGAVLGLPEDPGPARGDQAGAAQGAGKGGGGKRARREVRRRSSVVLGSCLELLGSYVDPCDQQAGVVLALGHAELLDDRPHAVLCGARLGEAGREGQQPVRSPRPCARRGPGRRCAATARRLAGVALRPARTWRRRSPRGSRRPVASARAPSRRGTAAGRGVLPAPRPGCASRGGSGSRPRCPGPVGRWCPVTG